MEILLVFDGLGIGGTERVGVDYVKILVSLGYNVDIVNLYPEANVMYSELPDSCRVHSLKYGYRCAPEAYSHLVRKGLLYKIIYIVMYILMTIYAIVYKNMFVPRELRKKKYDAVIAFSGHLNDISFVAYDFIQSKKKIAWVHGSLMNYTLRSPGFLTLYNKVKNIVVLSEKNQDEVLLTNSWLDLHITKMYNPSFISERNVDDLIVERLHSQYADYMIMVGRLDEDKDQLTIIKAVQYLRDRYKFEKKIVLVGDGKNAENLKKYVVDNGLSDLVIFIGSVMDVQNYYAAAFLFVHSSPLEGLPTTLVESLYFNLPIVATDSKPGVREILGDSEYGLVTPVGDYVRLAEEIYKMYSDENLYNKYKLASKRRFKLFDPQTIKKQLVTILDA